MDTQKLIARLRERAATQDACGCWSLDKAVADELERLAKGVALLTELEAQVDLTQLICYASTAGEYEPNRIVRDIHIFLEKPL